MEIKIKEEYVADEKFLRSIATHGGKARALGGLHTPEPALKFIELQLLNEISNKLSLLEKISDNLTKVAEKLTAEKEEKVVEKATATPLKGASATAK